MTSSGVYSIFIAVMCTAVLSYTPNAPIYDAFGHRAMTRNNRLFYPTHEPLPTPTNPLHRPFHILSKAVAYSATSSPQESKQIHPRFAEHEGTSTPHLSHSRAPPTPGHPKAASLASPRTKRRPPLIFLPALLTRLLIPLKSFPPSSLVPLALSAAYLGTLATTATTLSPSTFPAAVSGTAHAMHQPNPVLPLNALGSFHLLPTPAEVSS